jgi:DNA ligase 1
MMRDFARLLENLVLTPSRNGKLALLADYLRKTPDPDRGLALAAMMGELSIASVGAAGLRALAAQRVDPELFALSYDFVGDLAETIALIWPGNGVGLSPSVSEVFGALQPASRAEAMTLVCGWLDEMDVDARFALVKLVTGGLRVGLSSGLARLALQDLASGDRRDVTADEITEIWPAQTAPYLELFAWLEGRGERPTGRVSAQFRPIMLAHAFDEAALADLRLEDFQVEWKWDGIRVQAIGEGGTRRLYSRSGDDILTAFPDLVEAIGFEGVLDGELLVARPEEAGLRAGSFADLQKRLNRKTVTKAMLREKPAFLRAYDILFDNGEDVRPMPLAERRKRLEAFAMKLPPQRFDVSPVLKVPDAVTLADLRRNPPDALIEGLMLKRLDSRYEAGRPKGPWFKWKRDAMSVDTVIVYAQRGHGRRSGQHSDFTFAVWDGAPESGGRLVPVGKAYSGFTDAELLKLDRFVRENTIERFGPVRAVRAGPDFGLVLEIAFEGINASGRHKSEVALRFPRIARIRWEKAARDADHLETLKALIKA